MTAMWRKCTFVVILTLQLTVLVLYMTAVDLIQLCSKSEDVRTRSTDEGIHPRNTAYKEEDRRTSGVLRYLSDASGKDQSSRYRTSGQAYKHGFSLSRSHRWGRGNSSFQSIDNQEAWLYSAHFDHVASQNGAPQIRIFGVAKAELMTKVFCRLFKGRRRLTTAAELGGMPDAHDKPFRPCYVKCSLKRRFRPTHVSVSFLSSGRPTNVLRVLYPRPLVRNLTVCYSILHSGYRLGEQLIFSIEINRILGAEHFVIYNNNVSSNVELILRRYQKDGLVTVLPWSIPTTDSWYFSQMTALNDCFFRNRNSSRLVTVLDTDEILMPRKHDTWMDLISNLTPEDMAKSSCGSASNSELTDVATAGAFMVLSCFFTTNLSMNFDILSPQVFFTEEERTSINTFKMPWLLEVWRSRVVYPPRVRSKYIARPTLVDICGIHYVHKFVNDAKCFQVNEDLALIHHYRKSEELKALQNMIKTNRTIDPTLYHQDTTLLRYKNELIPRVVRQHKIFNNTFISQQ